MFFSIPSLLLERIGFPTSFFYKKIRKHIYLETLKTRIMYKKDDFQNIQEFTLNQLKNSQVYVPTNSFNCEPVDSKLYEVRTQIEKIFKYSTWARFSKKQKQSADSSTAFFIQFVLDIEQRKFHFSMKRCTKKINQNFESFYLVENSTTYFHKHRSQI